MRDAGCPDIRRGSVGVVSLKDLSYQSLTHSPQLKQKRTLLKGMKTLKISRRTRESSVEVRNPEEYSDQPHPWGKQQRACAAASRSRPQSPAHAPGVPGSWMPTATLSRKWILHTWLPLWLISERSLA